MAGIGGARMMVTTLLVAAGVGAVVSLGGCGGGPAKPTLYPVTGKVTVGGKPLADCTVVFGALDGKASYNGKLGSNGEFELSDPVDGRKGAAVGKYKVTLQANPEAAFKSMKPPTDGGAPSGPPMDMGGAGQFPKEYSSGDTTPKEVEVVAKTQTIDIEIP